MKRIISLTGSLLGFLIWLGAITALRPKPLEPDWGVGLLLLSPLVIAPQLLRISHVVQGTLLPTGVSFLGATLLAVSFCMERSVLAAVASVGWLLVTSYLAVHATKNFWTNRSRSVSDMAQAAGWIFLPVGAMWASFDRYGLRPLDFDTAIVLLTAIHFHYAGFVLPILTGLAAGPINTRLARVACYAVILGTPLVAVGITATQLGWPVTLETVAAVVMSIAAVTSAIVQLQAAMRSELSNRSCALLQFSALSLCGGMVLAAAYGLRYFLPLEWLTIERMRVSHGTINAIGYGFLGTVAWSLHSRQTV